MKRFSTVDSWVQPFTEWFAQTFEITLSIDGGIGAVPIVTFTGAMATPNRKPITAPLVVVPVNDVTGTGCLESDYDNIDAVGKIVVIKRGLCTFAIKSVIAKRRGAVGALIRNNVLTVVNGRLGGKDDYAPVGLIGLADGEMIVARLAAGEVLNATLLVDSIAEDRETWNVIAETKGGDPDNVIVVCESLILCCQILM